MGSGQGSRCVVGRGRGALWRGALRRLLQWGSRDRPAGAILPVGHDRSKSHECTEIRAEFSAVGHLRGGLCSGRSGCLAASTHHDACSHRRWIRWCTAGPRPSETRRPRGHCNGGIRNERDILLAGGQRGLRPRGNFRPTSVTISSIAMSWGCGKIVRTCANCNPTPMAKGRGNSAASVRSK